MKNLNLNSNLLWATIFFMFIGGNAFTQKNHTFYSLDNTAQSHYLNPAFKPSANVYVSFPLIPTQSFGVSNSGFNLSHVLSERTQDDSLQLTPELAVSKMAKRNFLTFESYNELFAVGFRIKKNYFSFGVTNRLNANLIYTKDLFQLAVEGNGSSFLGERASFDGTGVNLNSYIEYALGFNREFSDKLSIGARLKVLSGIVNVNTRKSKFGLHTDATTFDLTVDGSAIINTSGIKPFYDTLSPDGFDPMKTISNAYNFSNMGLAVDLGATYQLSKKIKLSASLLDLGFINWKTDNATFEVKDANYRFEGVDLNAFLQDTSDAVFDQLQDTLQNIFSQEENNEVYRTALETRFYLGGTFNLTKSINIGATLYNEVIKSNYRAALILSSTVRLNHWLSATVNYSNYARSSANIGFGLSVRGGPIQFYVASDNILAVVNPAKTKNVHLSFGFNMLFGKPDKKPVEKQASYE